MGQAQTGMSCTHRQDMPRSVAPAALLQNLRFVALNKYYLYLREDG
jgi:hypothetical protein